MCLEVLNLLKNKTSIPIRLRREMSSSEVEAKLLEPHFDDYVILDCVGVKLEPCGEQHPSGATLIDSALKRRGNNVYVAKRNVIDQQIYVPPTLDGKKQRVLPHPCPICPC